MKNDICSILEKSIVFKSVNKDEIMSLFHSINYSIKKFQKEEIIALEQSNCNNIGIIIEGEIEIKKMFSSGNIMTIDRLNIGDVFGEVIMFSNFNLYPASIIAYKNSTILFINKDEMIKIFSLNYKVLNSFMELLSNKILMLNRRVKNLSYTSIRQKISSFFLNEYKNQKTFDLKFNISRKEMAEYLAVPRPSLSREMIKMKKEGIITFDKNNIKLLNKEALEDYLM